MQPPILILTQRDTPHRFAGYITEMLRMEGLSWFEELDEAAFLDTAAFAPLPPLVIAPAVRLGSQVSERLASYVRAGGSLLACRPDAAVCPWLTSCCVPR